MDVEFLSRIQFALTASFHFIFPPITIGFALFIVFVEAMWLKTGDPKFQIATKFFLKIFAVLFSIGVATGIIMVFQFGTNWPRFSVFVGDVFGSPLAIEAVFAFFMESTFLGVALFGWNKVGKKTHFLSTFMVCLGAHLSAVWIIVANSFMQTPAGFEIAVENGMQKAVITDFWAMVFNPSTMDRLNHTISASWLSGAFLAMGICAYFILKNRPEKKFSVPCIKIATLFAAASALFMLYTGHSSSVTLATTQPEKLAAFEGHYQSAKNAPLYIVGWVDEKTQTTYGIKADGWLSKLAFGDFNAEVKGLYELPSSKFIKSINPNASDDEIAKLRPRYWAPVNFCFQTFRIMMYLGAIMCAIILLGGILILTGKVGEENFRPTKLFLLLCVPSVILPLLASQFGWAAAEVGRQPWTVWHIMETANAATTTASAGEIIFSITAFTILFTLITIVGLRVMLVKMRDGISTIKN